MPFDSTAPATLAPGHRPGERLIGAEVYVFNADLLGRYLADLAYEAAPTDLTALTYAELCSLVSAYLNRRYRVFTPENEAFGARVCAERASRPEYVSAFGARVAA